MCLEQEFSAACVYAVHCLVIKRPAPTNLYTLGGHCGDKYTIGGILINRVDDWTVNDALRIDAKIASINCRNHAMLRNRIPDLIVPLVCIVDYYGVAYECSSIIPIS